MTAEGEKNIRHIENAKTPEAEKPGAVIAWLEERIKSQTIQVDRIPLGQVSKWAMTTNSEGIADRFANIDPKDPQQKPKFFTFEGRRIWQSGREVGSFDQPAIVEVPDNMDPQKTSGVVGLLVDKNSGDILIQAAAEPMQAEPGSEPGAFVSLRASVQGSYTNISTHKVPYADKIDLSEYTNLVSVNPGRIDGKIRVGVTSVNKDEIDLSSNPNLKWFTQAEIDEAIGQNAPFNAFFHTANSIHNARKRIAQK